MDEIEKIHVKSGALIRARKYMLNQTPSDMIAVAHVTESIIDLTECHLAATGASKIPEVTTEEQRLLRQTIQALDDSLKQKASADQILSDAKAIYNLKPWPPGGIKPRPNPPGGLKSSSDPPRGLKPFPPDSNA